MLHEKYGGWQNISMVNYFNDFANLCFERFGNRVKYWITFNNPWVCGVRKLGVQSSWTLIQPGFLSYQGGNTSTWDPTFLDGSVSAW